jgi:hypothetical protein
MTLALGYITKTAYFLHLLCFSGTLSFWMNISLMKLTGRPDGLRHHVLSTSPSWIALGTDS